MDSGSEHNPGLWIDASPARLPKHVIVVSDYAHVTGGAAKVAINSAIGLAETGLDVHYFAAVGPVAESLLRPDLAIGWDQGRRHGRRPAGGPTCGH